MIKKVVLESGVRLIGIERNNTNVVALKIFIKRGSRDDTIPGITHFIEHMLFRNEDIIFSLRQYIERCGGIVNGNTTREYLAYYVVLPKEKLLNSIYGMLNILFKFKVTETNLELEKKVITKEILSYNNSSKAFWDLFLMDYWDSGCLRNPIIGSKKSIENIKCEDLYEYFYSKIFIDHIVISVCGDFSFPMLQNVIDHYFIYNQNLFTFSKKVEYSKSIVTKEKYKTINKPLLLDHNFIGFKIPGYEFKNRFIFYLYRNILTGGENSLLYKSLRVDNAMVYSVESNPLFFVGEGIFLIHVKTEKNVSKTVIETILEKINNLTDYDFEKNYQLLKSNYIGSLKIKLETNLSTASVFGIEELLLNEIETFTDLENKMKDFDPNLLKKNIDSYFTDFRIITIKDKRL